MLDAFCFLWKSWGHVVRTSNAVKPLCVLEDSRGVDFEEENHGAGAGVWEAWKTCWYGCGIQVNTTSLLKNHVCKSHLKNMLSLHKISIIHLFINLFKRATQFKGGKHLCFSKRRVDGRRVNGLGDCSAIAAPCCEYLQLQLVNAVSLETEDWHCPLRLCRMRHRKTLTQIFKLNRKNNPIKH